MRNFKNQFLIVLLISLVNFSLSNLWDSIFSNAYSKHYDLPLKGTLKLTTKNEKEEVIEIGLITYDTKIDKLCFNLKMIKFGEGYIPFNMITWVDFKTFINYKYQSEACTKDDKNKNMAGIVDLTFLLKSYELITVYNDANNDYYNYYLINKEKKEAIEEPKPSNLQSKFLDLKNLIVGINKEKITELVNDVLDSYIKNLETVIKSENATRNLQSIKFKKDPKEDSNFSFYVDKKTDKIKKIDIKYQLLKMEGLDSEYNAEIDEKELEINPICFKN